MAFAVQATGPALALLAQRALAAQRHRLQHVVVGTFPFQADQPVQAHANAVEAMGLANAVEALLRVAAAPGQNLQSIDHKTLNT